LPPRYTADPHPITADKGTQYSAPAMQLTGEQAKAWNGDAQARTPDV
jgi:hypothetical protein